MKCLWIFGHSWAKWEDVTFDVMLAVPDATMQQFIKPGQTRRCKDCGRRQDRYV